MKKKDKNNTLLIIGILLLIVIVGVGYATLNADLFITGTANIGTSTWNIQFREVNINNASTATVVTGHAPTVQTGSTEIEYQVNLNQPGDFYEFEAVIENTGSIDAILDSTDPYSITGGESYDYIIHTVKQKVVNPAYDSSNPNPDIPQYIYVDIPNDLELLADDGDPTTHTNEATLLVRVEYSRDVDADDIDNILEPLTLAFEMHFVQA